MVPCSHTWGSLIAIGFPTNGQLELFSGLGSTPATTPVERRLRTLHLSNNCMYSFINITAVQKLFHDKHGPDATLPPINGGTKILVQWHYEGRPLPEVTTHLALRDSIYDIILRKQDWEGPINQWLESIRTEKQHQQEEEQQQQQQQQQPQQIETQPEPFSDVDSAPCLSDSFRHSTPPSSEASFGSQKWHHISNDDASEAGDEYSLHSKEEDKWRWSFNTNSSSLPSPRHSFDATNGNYVLQTSSSPGCFC